MTSVAILGGGVAGLTCADELVERGFDVTLYEEGPELGGKARSYESKLHAPGGAEIGSAPSAEHGFRFFPGFYRHIDDTAKRIRISAALASRAPVKGAKTVFDCFVPIETEILAARRKPLIQLPASAPLRVNTLRTAIQLPQQLLGIGLTEDDIRAFCDKMWQVATSCRARRHDEYEGIKWSEFIESPGRSDEYYWYLASGLTRGLVAARANLASTKTMGDLALRFLTLLTEAAPTTDRVLCGPTNVMWIDPWVDHIRAKAKAKGVEFSIVQREVATLEQDASGVIGGTAGGETVRADYYISALPLESLSNLLAASNLDNNSQFAGIRKLANRDSQCLRTMRGIQIYLKKDVPLNRGHQLYLDSPWALTSISQAQFWGSAICDVSLPEGAKGVLSVDISSWDIPSMRTGKSASDTEPLEIFREVVDEIAAALGDAAAAALFSGHGEKLGNVLGWHLDHTPHRLLVNNVGSWKLRPAVETHLENLFLAGDFVQTETDLACMEGANEAARRAVNALIERETKRRHRAGVDYPRIEKCRLFPVARPKVFAALEELDAFRYGKSLPWAGVSVGGWLLNGAQAGEVANEVLFSSQQAEDPPLIGQGGKAIDVATDVTSVTSNLPRDDRAVKTVEVCALTPQQVRLRLSPDETAGRVDPMFQRWRPYQLEKDPVKTRAAAHLRVPRTIPFHAYDADALILHGKVHNFEWLSKRTPKGWRPVESRIDGRSIGFAELWIMNYSDTTTGPYKELVINFVVTKDPKKPLYQWNSPYSVLVPMNDPANRLYTPLLLLDELEEDPFKLTEGGPIAYGNDLLGTDKRAAKIKLSQSGSLRRFACGDALEGHVDIGLSWFDTVAAMFEITRQVGPTATAQGYRQRTDNEELSGGIVTSRGEIGAAYKFAPVVGLFRGQYGARFALEPKSGTAFGDLLFDAGFEPVMFSHDPHLKTVLYMRDWPSPDDIALASRDSETARGERDSRAEKAEAEKADRAKKAEKARRAAEHGALRGGS